MARESTDDDQTSRPRSSQSEDDGAQGPIAVALAGLIRASVYALKTLPRGMVKATLQRKAFLTLGRRTFSGAIAGPTSHYETTEVKPASIVGKIAGKKWSVLFRFLALKPL